MELSNSGPGPEPLAELMYDFLESSVAKDLMVANLDPGIHTPFRLAGGQKRLDARAGDSGKKDEEFLCF